MNRFYLKIYLWSKKLDVIYYDGTVFTGVSFRDQKGLVVKISKQSYYAEWGNFQKNYILESTLTSLVCGRETDTSFGWMPVGGPIKGFYVVKNGADAK
jgi:hypothetical protein